MSFTPTTDLIFPVIAALVAGVLIGGWSLITGINTKLDVLTDNHAKHIQEGIQQLNEKSDKQTELLVSMDKSLAVIADRTQVL